ncbi:MAG: formyltransferase family protein [Nanoarchaeota archaeon]
MATLKKIILAGRGTLATKVLDHLIESGINDLVVIPATCLTKDSTQKNLKQEAEKRGIKVYNGNASDYQKDVDLAFSIGYNLRFREDFLRKCSGINLHLSPLPRYGGFNPFYWAIRSGDTEYGVTLHEMGLEFDVGNIISQKRFSILPSDNARDLFDRAGDEALIMFKEIFPSILSGTYASIPQDLTKKTYYQKDAVDFKETIPLEGSTKELHNRIRATIFPPLPNPKIYLLDRIYSVESSLPHYGVKIDGSKIIEEDRVLVATTDSSVELKVKKA